MKIIEVIPIAKGMFKDKLTYFSTQAVMAGMVVTVPVKNKEIDALVTNVTAAEQIKAQIKTSDFSLKKMGRIKNTSFFLPEFMIAAAQAADYFAASFGQIIKELTPKIILENLSSIRPNSVDSVKRTNATEEFTVIQESEDERLSFYKSLIREAFARKQSVFWCLPTASDVDNIHRFIAKGIEQYVVVLHNKLSKKELIAGWKKATISNHALLIIATPMFLSLPRRDLETIILDKENSTAYKSFSRPFLDYRVFAELLARQRKIRLIFGDTALRSEIIYRTGQGEFLAAVPLKYRLYTEAKQNIANLNKTGTNKQIPDEERGSSLSEKMIWQMENSRDRSERMFVFAARRGLAAVTVCSDCNTVIACDLCHSPLVLHRNLDADNNNRQRLFLCHKCGQIVEIDDQCGTCGGWRLSTLGYGLEKIESDIRTALPDLKIFRLDSDSANTPKKAREIVEKFYAAPGSLLVGTEMALFYLNEPIENVAVASIDPLFALPDFRISEKLFNLLLKLRLLASRKFLIQTRNPEEKVFQFVLAGNLLDFYREEIAERKKFGYAPFKLLIKISLEGRKEEVKKEMDQLAKKLEPWQPLLFPSPTAKNENRLTANALIKLDLRQWVDKKLLTILRSLPPTFIVNVDPETIL